jgi:bisanhydrobacterioruberin hydratase
VRVRFRRDVTGLRRDLGLSAILGLYYTVGVVGHLVPPLLPLMAAVTPAVLAIMGLLVAAVAVAEGGWPVALWAAGTYAVSFALEAAGVATGAIFGPYSYGNVLGPMALDVPLVIGFNWMLTVLGGMAIARELGIGRGVGGRTDEDGPCPICVAAATGVACVLFDFALEPVAIRLGYWTWYTRGVPVQNYVAWFVIATLSALAFPHRRAAAARAGAAPSLLPAASFLLQLLFFGIQALAG